MDIRHISIAGIEGTNQDRLLCEQLADDTCLAILADGMGGLQHGDLAADIVACSIYNKVKAERPLADIPNALRAAFVQADRVIAERSMSLHCKMGAAVAVVVAKGDTLYYAWQGNVRLYSQEGHNLSLLTEDHTKSSDCTTLLTRCVNGKGYRYPIPVQSKSLTGTTFLALCTDGFYQSEICMKHLGLGDLSPSGLGPQPDDASCIILALKQ